MPENLEEKIARFLKDRRGALTYAAFARKLGVPPSTLFRIEHRQQSPTLRIMEHIFKRLKCTYQDVFDYKPAAGSVNDLPEPSTPARGPYRKRRSPKKRPPRKE